MNDVERSDRVPNSATTFSDSTLSTGSTYFHSENPTGLPRQDSDPLMGSTRSATSVFNLTSVRATEMKITAMERDDDSPPERAKDYKGRLRTWPGVVLVLGIIAAAGVLITMGAVDAHNKSTVREQAFEQDVAGNRRIKDGLNSSSDTIDDDGQIGNPKKYPAMGCELPNYLSKNGQIYARSKNGTEVPIGIKGVNWFGMETGQAIPFGLWENEFNGTTAYEISSFLARNKFNSVRLPVCIKSILSNLPPDKTLINVNTNRAIDVSSYMATLKSIIKVLAYRHVSVLISLHKLDTQKPDGAWYDAGLGVSESDFLKAVDILTKNLCGPDYWNVVGLDLKNEPHMCNWGEGGLDWQKGATLIGNRMLNGCPNWLAFVEGVNGIHSIKTTIPPTTYSDWWGGGLQNAGEKPVVLKTQDKVVYAPHFYNTGVAVQGYLYGTGSNPSVKYIELDDATLKNNVYAVFEDMFGYLGKKKQSAVVLGEFAGLYATDAHPKLTTKRTTDFTIQAAIDMGLAGGYMWSLNPESAYQHNPANVEGNFIEGLLLNDWLTPNTGFVKGMAAMDSFPNLKMFPCFPA